MQRTGWANPPRSRAAPKLGRTAPIPYIERAPGSWHSIQAEPGCYASLTDSSGLVSLQRRLRISNHSPEDPVSISAGAIRTRRCRNDDHVDALDESTFRRPSGAATGLQGLVRPPFDYDQTNNCPLIRFVTTDW